MKGYHDSTTPENIRDQWRTPKWLFDFYNDRFDFDMDVAASHDNHLVDEYLTINDDALHSRWGYSCFLNPPYSDVLPWINQALSECCSGSVVVMLLPADTSVKWFKKAFDNCTECHFISGRIAFINEETRQPVSGNNKGSVVFIFDPKSPLKQQVVMLDRDEMKNQFEK